ncbi:MAG: hypothetical protein HYT69_01960 [Candidatus Zambryskibacteria bacterium]|nr:hypothetical protein [Candidatus Zambryskibacteria bacterium]
MTIEMKSYWDNLLKKAKDALAKNINEVSVLYSLVQLNKFAEDRGRESEFPTIRLYRDWLVHTDLDRPRHLIEFFEKLDEAIDDIRKGGGIEVAEQKIVIPLKFVKLFDELSVLGISLDTDQKALFIKSLVDGLIDAPLRWKGKHVKEFRFTYDNLRKKERESYFCHIQGQLIQGDKWFDGPELHYEGEGEGEYPSQKAL